VTDWKAVLGSVRHRVFYTSLCAGCGKQRLTPVFTSQPQFCNRACHDAWEALHGRHMDAGQ
jgi:hypothetical protein